jgi:predicted proteasome-type protease
MKKIFLVAMTCMALASCSEQCFTSYEGITLAGISKKSNSGTPYQGWYETDYFVNELNFKIRYNKRTELYADCKEFVVKHGINFSNIKIQCNSPIVVGGDTLAANTNLYQFFTSTNYNDDVTVLQWNTASYSTPVATEALNMFLVEVPLSDGTKLSKSALVSLSK